MDRHRPLVEFMTPVYSTLMWENIPVESNRSHLSSNHNGQYNKGDIVGETSPSYRYVKHPLHMQR